MSYRIINVSRRFLFLLSLLPFSAFASTSTTYSVPAQVVASSGQTSTSTVFGVRCVAGQASAIGISTSATFTVSHGFIPLEGGEFLPDGTYSAGLLGATDGKGVAWGDFNGDGALDFYVARGSGAKVDYLFENVGSTAFTNVAADKGITLSQAGFGAGWADIDVDGKLDAYVRNAETSAGVLWGNKGASGFANVTGEAGLSGANVGVSAVWGDYDGDGLPDLFMASTNGGLPHLYQNKGAALFERTDDAVGLTQSTWGSGVWGDYDNDGDLDLFIAQQAGHADLLYENLGGTGFVEVAAARGITGTVGSYGASWGDYDNDGDLDLYVINTGANSDILYRNNAGTFSDVSSAVGISDSYDGRSAAWSDFDADGDLDLYVANCGTNGEPDAIYYNDGDGTFTLYLTTHRKRSYGAAWGDYDGNGSPDLLVTREGENLSLYRNNKSGSWLKVRPLNSEGAQSSYGSRVLLYLAGTDTLVASRQIDGGHGTGCQDAYDAYFGIPAGDTNCYDIEVHFVLRGDPLGTGTNQPIVVNKEINPDLGGILPDDVGTGFVEVRDNGRVFVAQGTLFVSGGEVWLLQNSGAVNALTSAGGDDPAGSPDGGRFVFSSDRNGSQDLFVKLLSGGAADAYMTNAACNFTRPAWATDNSGIAYCSDQDGNLDIYVSDMAGKGTHNLTEHPSNDWDAAWSPNSAKIVFSSDRDGATNVWLMDYDGSNLSNLTQDVSVNIEPAWSPDGLHIAFTSYRDGDAEICVMNFDGSSPVNISLSTSEDRHPTWNDEGTEIIFESDRLGTNLLFACKPDGRDVRLLSAMVGEKPSYPMSYKYPPRSVVFGEKNGRISYWADPVNTEDGNFVITDNDFVLTGRGSPIRFSRYYNSQSPFDGIMGFGWRHSYMVDITRELNGNATITWGDGHQDFFLLFGSNTFTKIFGTTPGSLRETATGFTFISPDQTRHNFSIAGRLVEIVDKNSNVIALTYSTNELITVSQPNGRNISLDYVSNRLSTVTDHTGRQIGLGYNEAGDLTAYTNVCRKAWMYTYDDSHRMVSKRNPLDIMVVSNEYGSVGRVIKQWDANGALTQYEYSWDTTNNTRMTTITDPLNRVVIHKYDAYRRLISVDDGQSNKVRYGYDANGYRDSARDRLDEEGRVYAFNSVGQPTQAIDSKSNSVSIVYDGNNNPRKHIDELDREINYAYDSVGNLTDVTNALGDSTATTYNPYGQPTHMTDEKGNTTILGYDGNGDLVSITDSLGRVKTLTYDSLGRVETVTDAMTNIESYTYTSNNLLASTTNPQGGQTVYEYDDDDRVMVTRTQLNDSEWAVVSNVYDSVGHVVEKVDARGYSTRYAYDGYGNMIAMTNALNGVTRYAYNADNQVTQVVDAAGAVTTFEYDLNGRLIRRVLPGTNRTWYTYNSEGLVVSVTNALGASQHYEYDAAGQLVRAVDERGSVIGRGYDALGRVSVITNQIGEVIRYGYDKTGNRVSVTNELGFVTTYGYDAANNMVAVTNAAGAVTAFSYDLLNRVVATMDGRTNTTAYAYDAVGNLLEETYADGTTLTYEYDLAGRLTNMVDTTGHATKYEYDVAGNLVRLRDRLGYITQWEYDALGRKSRMVNPNGHDIRYFYDAASRMTNLVDHLGNAVAFEYDTAGRLVRTTGPRGGTEDRTYDKLGRLLSQSDALSRTEYYSHDAGGLVTNFISADSKAVNYEYDAAGRMTNIAYPDYTTATYSYDAAGNLIEVAEQHGSSTNMYDELNRLILRTDVYGKTVGYEYDPANNVKTIIYPHGERVEYNFDAMNRMIRVEDWLTNVTTYAYDNIGNLAAVTNANGTQCAYTYDDDQRLVSLRNRKADHTPIAEQVFTRDDGGNVIREQRNYPVLPVLNEGDVATTYDIADQVQTTGTDAVTHDLTGNLTEKGSKTYQYDYANRLTDASFPGGFAAYEYDDAGNRISKQAFAGSFVQHKYTLDVNRKLVSVLTENNYFSGNEEGYYVYGLGLIARIDTENNTRVYHYDAVGSTIALTDESESISDSYAYASFGEVLNSSGASAQPFKYVGQYGVQDEGYGLLYMRARYYDVAMGRFVSLDPVRNMAGGPSGLSKYCYVANNPSVYIDPEGELGTYALAALGGTVMGLGVGAVAGFSEEMGWHETAETWRMGSTAHGLQTLALYPTGHGAVAYAGGVVGGVSGEGWGWGAANVLKGIGWLFKKQVQLGIDTVDWIGRKLFNSNGTDDQYENYELMPGDKTPGSSSTSPANEGELTTKDEANPTQEQWLDAIRREARRAARKRADRIEDFFESYVRRQRLMQGAIDSLTRGRGWESLSGQHGQEYTTATYDDKYGTVTKTFLSGYWYWNVSRELRLATPKPTFTTWLSAHAAQRSAVRDSLAQNYTANGINTPWIPEVYEAYVIDGKFAVYGK